MSHVVYPSSPSARLAASQTSAPLPSVEPPAPALDVLTSGTLSPIERAPRARARGERRDTPAASPREGNEAAAVISERPAWVPRPSKRNMRLRVNMFLARRTV